MFKHISKLVLSLPVAAVFLFSGCGGGEGTHVQGGSLTVNPTSVDIAVGAVGPCTGVYSYTAINITLQDRFGRPVDGNVSVILDWSTATTTGAAAMILYDDPSWLGGSSTPPTNPVGGTYVTNTGSGGTKRLIVAMDLTCEYTGNFYVSADYGLFDQATLSVTGAAP